MTGSMRWCIRGSALKHRAYFTPTRALALLPPQEPSGYVPYSFLEALLYTNILMGRLKLILHRILNVDKTGRAQVLPYSI